jgi:hypothetical protein
MLSATTKFSTFIRGVLAHPRLLNLVHVTLFPEICRIASVMESYQLKFAREVLWRPILFLENTLILKIASDGSMTA